MTLFSSMNDAYIEYSCLNKCIHMFLQGIFLVSAHHHHPTCKSSSHHHFLMNSASTASPHQVELIYDLLLNLRNLFARL